MTLVPGTRLGPYEITAKLGEGGMGEVWRATDSRLGREVALKLLPEGFADDPERHARFEREARTLASLNHPNIATLYGLEHLDGKHALAMELVEGEGLDETIARGAILVDEAIPIALQIAEGLEAAHEHGIVHRDLKPANIRIRPDGTVKVLDFGLAKAWAEEVGGSDLSISPTITARHTAAGVILGTAAYMAPEQAAGNAVDTRADIWSFGVVLWEMLTGRQLFGGETVSHVLASVLKDEVDLAALPAQTPVRLRELIERCLRRKPRQRLQAIGDARVLLEEVESGGLVEPVAAPPSAPTRRAAFWATTTVLIAVVSLAIGWVLHSVPETSQTLRFAQLPMPSGTHLALSGIQPGPPTVSPDGTRVAFVAENDDGARSLWVRDLAQPKARKLEGTEGASYPFWSPDGRQIAFFAHNTLQRMPAKGGASFEIAEAPSGKGGTWNRSDVILFAPAFNSPISRVSADGGPVQEVTRLDFDRGEQSHRFPRFLEDGERFLYLSRGSVDSKNRIMLGALDGRAPHEVLHTSANAVESSGVLFYLRDGSLFAQHLDHRSVSLAGAPVPIAADLRVIRSAARIVADAAPGTLVFQTGGDLSKTQLVWLDRHGERIGTIGEPAFYVGPRISPDGRRIAAHEVNPDLGTYDIWIVDVASGRRERVTFAATTERQPVWSPDGRSIAYAANPNGPFELFVKDVDGQSPAKVLLANRRPDFVPSPQDWTRDGKELVFQSWNAAAGVTQIWSLATDAGSTPRKVVESTYRDDVARVSPDGRWIVYGTTVDASAPTVMVSDFPQAKHQWQVARGSNAWWSRDGRELFVVDPDEALQAIEVQPRGDQFEWGSVQTLFRMAGRAIMDPGDGRFLALESANGKGTTSCQLRLVLGWRKLLERR
jgi:eukaryotic-like serine/threonine-protein kinase